MYIRHIFGIVFFWATLYILCDINDTNGLSDMESNVIRQDATQRPHYSERAELNTLHLCRS